MSILNLIRPELLAITAYIPTEDNRRHRLHANESPWSPIVFQNLALNHYPNLKDQERVQTLLANCFAIKQDELLITRGSDDGIDLLMRVFLRAGIDSILQCPPTFSMYAFYAQLQQATVINCPLPAKAGFDLSLDQLIASWTPNCKLILLCQPNNPTGNLLKLDNIAALCDYFTAKAVVVVDEAYIDFANVPSATTLLGTFENLIVLRTLSKAYGLAGLRLGAVCAQAHLIRALRNTLAPFTLSSVVMALAEKALENREWFSENIQRIVRARTEIFTQLQQLPWIEAVYPSQANFILLASPYALALMEHFANRNLAVRDFKTDPLKNMIRITIGNDLQNQALMNALNTFKPM
jgi:histidinol-phosphate aminotransferase